MAYATARSPSYRPRRLLLLAAAQVLWAFATLVGNSDSPTQELAGLVGALAEGFESEGAGSGLRGVAGGGLDAATACDVLWSFATMGHPAHSLCEAMGRELVDHVRRGCWYSLLDVFFLCVHFLLTLLLCRISPLVLLVGLVGAAAGYCSSSRLATRLCVIGPPSPTLSIPCLLASLPYCVFIVCCLACIQASAAVDVVVVDALYDVRSFLGMVFFFLACFDLIPFFPQHFLQLP